MKKQYVKGVGTCFIRREYALNTAGEAEVRVSADPHTYIRDFCPSAYHDTWLMGGTYIKYHIWLDGRYIGCGTERAVITGTRVEQRFPLGRLTAGKHLLAIAFRGEKQGLNAEIFSPDGQQISGGTWKFFDANLYDGHICYRQPHIYGYFKGDIGPGEYFEHLDGTRHPDNWQLPDFDDSKWENATLEYADHPTVPASYNLETTFVHPQKLFKTRDNRWIADFGVETIGSLLLTGPEKGGEVEVRLAEEMLDEDHVRFLLRCIVCYQENWLFAPGRQLLGHFGVRQFRYAEIVNYDGELHPEDITLRRIHAPFSDTSVLTTDNENLRQIWDLCKRTIKYTATDCYTDCFTRERIAYEADALLNMQAAFAVSDTMMVARRHLEYQLTHLTWPVEWKQFAACLFYEFYQECKDADFVTAHFDELVKISSFEEWIEENGLIRTFGKNPRCIIDWPPAYTEKYDFGEKREYLFVPNALAVKVMRQLAYLAEATGRKDDAVRLRKKSEYMCRQLNELCYNRQTGLYTDRFGSENCSFHANMWALWCDIVPEERQDKVVDFVSASGMVCGLYSGVIYLETLFRYGKSRQATELLLGNDSAWLTMIRMGNTLTVEHWPKAEQRMSVSHPWASYPVYFFYKYIFGIRATSPGWETYEICPDPAAGIKGTLKVVRNGRVLISECR